MHDVRTHDGNRSLWWGEPEGKWGDLTNMSYLAMIPRFREAKMYDFTPLPNRGEPNIDLYLYGDSYTGDVPKEVLMHVNDLHFIFRIGSFDFVLNRNKRNILLLELSERYLRGRFKDTGLTDCIRTHNSEAEFPHDAPTPPSQETQLREKGLSIKNLFNPYINQNLEYHLFNYKFFLSFRHIKAAINYYLFHRASGDVVISDDDKYLFFKPTVGNSPLSSYYPLKKGELQHLLQVMNSLYAHFRQAGFDEVYLSVIPNSASILQPAPYNQLIPRLQNDPGLKMPYIDLYSIFKQYPDPASLHRAGDTHWNNSGMQLWLKQVNEVLMRESKKAITPNRHTNGI